MRILLTNDDGINARGLHSLINKLNTIAEIYVVAPRSEQSGTGHSITVFDPIKAIETKIPGIKKGWLVGGTPVDCVKLGTKRLVPEPIDLVVSGINHGSNLGTDVLYSGTVSAATEGVIMGYPAIAVSLDTFDCFPQRTASHSFSIPSFHGYRRGLPWPKGDLITPKADRRFGG